MTWLSVATFVQMAAGFAAGWFSVAFLRERGNSLYWRKRALDAERELAELRGAMGRIRHGAM
jgi:hypothetical protein